MRVQELINIHGWARIGRGVVWGLGALACTAGTGGWGLLFCFYGGYLASVDSELITQLEQQVSAPGGGGAQGAPAATGGGTPDTPKKEVKSEEDEGKKPKQ